MIKTDLQEIQKNKFKLMYSAEQIHDRIKMIAEEISSYYADKELTVMVIMNGGFIFASDLVRELKISVQIDFLAVCSYSCRSSTGTITFRSAPKYNDYNDRNLLLVDDIVDTGLTMLKLKEYFERQGIASIRLCTLLDKEIPSEKKLCHPDWCAFTTQNQYLVGYGLDFDEKYRNFPDIYALL